MPAADEAAQPRRWRNPLTVALLFVVAATMIATAFYDHAQSGTVVVERPLADLRVKARKRPREFELRHVLEPDMAPLAVDLLSTTQSDQPQIRFRVDAPDGSSNEHTRQGVTVWPGGSKVRLAVLQAVIAGEYRFHGGLPSPVSKYRLRLRANVAGLDWLRIVLGFACCVAGFGILIAQSMRQSLAVLRSATANGDTTD